MTVTGDDIEQSIRSLDLSGAAICVHSSLRSFGWVNGGADAVIDALLGEGCTVMVPSHYYEAGVSPPADLRPPRNGFDYEAWDRDHAGESGPGEHFIFTPASNEISARFMGAIPSALVRRPERERGNHPEGSFAALGPLARVLVKDQTPGDPFAPFRALAELRGYVVMMGVGLDRLTLLHHAEQLAGRNLFMRWANGPHGDPIAVFGGGCSAGFPRLEPSLAHLITKAMVGTSLWRVLPAAQTVTTAASVIRDRPSITHCEDPDCIDCNDAVLGGPIL